MSAMAQMSGSRLAYVVVPIEGTVKRTTHKFVKGEGVVAESDEQPGGFLVYFPRGHVVRIRDKKQLKHYKLDRKPSIINIQGLNDPNSPIGKLIAAQDDQGRSGAMRSMEMAVIQLATAKTGKVLMPEQVREIDEDSDDPTQPLRVSGIRRKQPAQKAA